MRRVCGEDGKRFDPHFLVKVVRKCKCSIPWRLILSLGLSDVWQPFDVSYLVLEGLRSQSFVEWCEVSGETLKVALYLLLLKVR